MAITQVNRALTLKTPLGKDVLLVERAEFSERLSQPFHGVLDLVSESGDVAMDDLLGKEVTLSYTLPSGGATREFTGFVTEFAQTGYVSRMHRYRAVVQPWLWFLTRTSDCRIFQKKTIPDIFEEVVKAHGFTDYRLKLTGTYQPWVYCVQYRETDFNFVSRLLEQEGIHYYFEHRAGHHTLVLCDDSTTLGTVPGYERIPFFSPDDSGTQSPRDHFGAWSVTRSVVPGAYATTDYDFEAPRKSLLARTEAAGAYARSGFEVFDFPAEVGKFDPDQTQRLAKIRLEELQASHFVARGHGDAAGVATGARFRLVDHPRKDYNADYLVTGVRHVLQMNAYGSGDGGGAEFGVSVEAVEAKTKFRPARVTPKPSVQGTQTAMVVGKAGEEIDTDAHGRVRVQFPWDRTGKSNETSSCWVRVAQVWAGKNWGAIHIPRIGQEVLVSFLEGDPDRPIITGRVYNGDSKPPYDLPANATQSGIKSRSSKGGASSNFNEIRFEDKAGEEELHFQAEKDLTTLVKHDQKIKVDNDETVTVKHDRSDSVGNDEKRSVTQNRTTEIGSNEAVKIGKNETVEVGENASLKVGTDQKLDVGQNYSLKAGSQITLETGASKLVMKADGTIELSGVQLTIKGQTISISGLTIKVAADATLDVKGAMTTIAGTMVKVNADAMAQIQGGLTMIG